MVTECPSPISFFTDSGVAATRVSPGLVSFKIVSFMARVIGKILRESNSETENEAWNCSNYLEKQR
jgi:hypothetical protein